MTDDAPIASHSFCVVEGCSGPSTISRMVSIWGDDHQVDVCEKHEDTELTEENVDQDKLNS